MMNKNIIRFYSDNRENNNNNKLLANNNDKEKIEVIQNNIKKLKNLENKQAIVLENYKKSCENYINSVESGTNPYNIIDNIKNIEGFNSINDNLLLDNNNVDIYNTNIDNIEYKNTNSLSLNYNLIDDQLKNMLNKGFRTDYRNNENPFYMVVFNVIKNNKGEKILIYNYRKYNEIFLNCFISFIIIEHMSQIINYDSNIGNGLFFILDEKLKNKNNILYDYLLEEEINKYKDLRLDLGYNTIDIFKLLVNGKLPSININDISYIIKLIETLKIGLFFDTLNKYNDIDMDKYNILIKSGLLENKKNIHNILSRFVLVVSDLDDLIKNLKSLGYKEVNQGPQKLRGSGSYINYILTCLDNNFRYSMYIHNLNQSRNSHNNNPISRNKFSYKNIHMNICGVRWYSTSRINRINYKTNILYKNGIVRNESLINDKKSNFTSYSKTNNKESLSLVNIDNNSQNTVINVYNKNIKSKKDFSTFIFINLVNILENNPINENTQLKIEKLIFEQFNEFISNKENPLILGVDFSKFSKNFKEHCFEKIKEINIYLKKLKNNLNSNKKLSKDFNLLKGNLINDYYLRLIINNVSNNEIVNIMLYTLLIVITYNDIIDNDENEENNEKIKTALLSNNLKLGKLLVDIYIRNKYKDYTNKEEEITYLNYKELILRENNDIFNSEELYLHIGSKLIEIMVTCNMLSIKIINRQNNSLAVLKITDEISSKFDKKNTVIAIPKSLPMIVQPKPYTEKNLGGYLLNDIEYDQPIFTKKIGYGNISKIENNSIIYSVINNMMKTPFKVNKELLNYILNNNHKHKLLINPEEEHEFSQIKRNKYQDRKYQSFMSEKLLQENIIKIAQTYSNIPEIYFPIKLDNRGRLYPIPEYFHYQASELAKSLILFARPDIIQRNDTEAIEYLKAYGATCYGNDLNNKSYLKRLEWVENNWNKIINYENSDLIDKAKEKFLFISFCIEMKRFNNFLNNEYINEFKTYLPIQLDGTCNGFQHLALLSNEIRLFENLNLEKAKKSDDPKDFYEHIIHILNVYIEEKRNYTKDINLINSYTRLLNLGITRINIKPVIMTKPYNAKEKTLEKYIINTLILNKIEKKIDEKTVSWYKINNNNENLVSSNDINLLVKCINEIIYVNYPRIKWLSEYLDNISKILNKLNLPIVWRLPHGLMISQKYMLKHSKKIKPFSFLKTTLALTITDKIKIDKRKQSTALMPNLVHSLDASTLTLLYNSFYNSIDNNNVNFYSVHDCYGVTAKYVNNLISILRTIYIDIYSNKGYIQKFDLDVINSIITAYGDDKCKFDPDKRIIYIDKKKIILPKISHIIDTPNKHIAYKSLSKSIFLIK